VHSSFYPGGCLTPAPGDSGSAAEGMQRISSSGTIMQSSLARTAAAPEPYRWN